MWAAIRRDGPGCFRELDEAQQQPDLWTRQMAIMMTAMFYGNEGRVDEMIAGLETALAGFRALGDTRYESVDADAAALPPRGRHRRTPQAPRPAFAG